VDGGDLVVVVPASCRRRRCEPARLERWTDRDSGRRETVAEGFEDVALDATGRAALLLGLPMSPEMVRVVDTRGQLSWRVGGLDPASRFGWPQAIALAPGGTVAALLETGLKGGRLRLVERDGSGSTDAFVAASGPASLTFVGTEAEPTLLVGGQGFVAVRRGGSRPPPALPYEPTLPTGFRPNGQEGFARVLGAEEIFGPRRSWHGPGHVSVLASTLEPDELAPALDDETFAARGFRRVAGVVPERLTDPDRALRVWRDERGRHAEMVVPACHEGVSNTDDYHRLTQTEEALVHVQVVVPPGTPPGRVRSLLGPFVDGPLGPPPRPRALPALPERSCGI
jgi:hypothetical protein